VARYSRSSLYSHRRQSLHIRYLEIGRQLKTELSHWRIAVQTAGTVASGHSAIDHASDRFTFKTRYSPLDGSKTWMKDQFR